MDPPSSSFPCHRLTFGQAFIQTFSIVLGHLDVFSAIGACHLLPLLAYMALHVWYGSYNDNDDASQPNNNNNITVVLFENSTVTPRDNDAPPLSNAWFVVFEIVLATSFLVLFLVCSGATIQAAGHVLAAPLMVADDDHTPFVMSPSPSFVTCMQRGWKRACSLLGAMLTATMLMAAMTFFVLLLWGGVLDAKHMPLSLQMMLSTALTAVSVGAMAYIVAGCVCLRPAVVWGRQGIVQAVRQSFALAAGQQWYILCLQLTIALVEAVVVVTLWTVLGDFSLMVLLGSAESTLAVVALVGGTASVLFLLLSPAFSLVYVTKQKEMLCVW